MECRDEIQAGFVAEPQIDECQIKPLACRFIDRIAGIAHGNNRVAIGFKTDGQRLADVQLVVDD